MYVLCQFWVSFGLVLGQFRIGFGSVLVSFWLSFGSVSDRIWLSFWLSFGSVSDQFCVHHLKRFRCAAATHIRAVVRVAQRVGLGGLPELGEAGAGEAERDVRAVLHSAARPRGTHNNQARQAGDSAAAGGCSYVSRVNTQKPRGPKLTQR